MIRRSAVIGLILAVAVTESAVAAESGSVRDCGSAIGNPYVAQVTCYDDPGNTATGSDATEGIIAGPSEWIGCTAAVYEVAEDGSLGEFIGFFPVQDTGYGHSIPAAAGYKSEIIQGKTPGTVETGITLDFRQPSRKKCIDFMKRTFTGSGTTGSQVWVQIVRGEG